MTPEELEALAAEFEFDDDQTPERDEHYEYETHLADDDSYGDLRYESEF